MMQPIFRVILVIVSLLTMSFMMRKIRQAKVQIEAAMFWVIVALILVVFSLFPAVADACAHLLGIYSTPNFLFLFMIFLLMVKVFSMTLQVSQMESKQKELVQKIALAQKEREELELKMQVLLGGHASLVQVAHFGLGQLPLGNVLIAQLNSLIAFLIGSFLLDDGAGTRLDDGDGDDLAVFVEDLRHANLLADDCFHV